MYTHARTPAEVLPNTWKFRYKYIVWKYETSNKSISAVLHAHIYMQCATTEVARQGVLTTENMPQYNVAQLNRYSQQYEQ